MKRVGFALIASLLITGCTLVGVGGVTAVEDNGQVVVRNSLTLPTTVTTVALTGADATFSVNDPTCKEVDKKFFIWNCDLGPLKVNDPKFLPFDGDLVSGTVAAIESGTKRYLVDVVRTQ